MLAIGILRLVEGTRKLVSDVQGKSYVEDNPDVFQDPEKMRTLFGISPELGSAVIDRSERMQTLIHKRAFDRATFLKTADDEAAQAANAKLESGGSYRDAVIAGNDVWQTARLKAKREHGGGFADAIDPVWNFEGYTERYPRYDQAIEGLRESYTVQRTGQPAETVSAFPWELPQMQGPGVVVQKMGTAAAAEAPEPGAWNIVDANGERTPFHGTEAQAVQQAEAVGGTVEKPGTSPAVGANAPKPGESVTLMSPDGRDLRTLPKSEAGFQAEFEDLTGKGWTTITQQRTGAPGDFTPKTKADVQGAILKADDQIARLEEIEAGFKPEYLTVPVQAWIAGKGWQEKLGMSLDPEDQQYIEGATAWKLTAIDNLNRYIKEITGAQMSEPEAARLRKAMPDPEKDAPTVFAAKMRASVAIARRVRERYARLLQEGELRPGQNFDESLAKKHPINLRAEDIAGPKERGAGGAAVLPNPDAQVTPGTFKNRSGKTFHIVPAG